MGLLLLLAVPACASLSTHNQQIAVPGAVVTSTPIRWNVDATCLLRAPQPPNSTRETLAAACPATPRDLLTVALSGGGTKAAVFAGETLFYLDFLGLLQRTSIISAVSGGSFAGALYALSCDPGAACSTIQPNGRARPIWQHDTVMDTLGQGYGALIGEQVGRAIIPFVHSSVSAARFASVIDRDFLGNKQGGQPPFRFADLNPARPHLFLNATITSQNRVGLEEQAGNGCSPLSNRGFLRRRTPDEYFHFAFTDTYFARLNSRTATYPLASAVAASSAFPALIDFAQLTDYCASRPENRTVQLMDGGANDNQALIEIYLTLAELVFRQHRSDLWVPQPHNLELLTPRNRAFLIVVNSSVTEETGTAGPDPRPYGLVGLLSGALTKSLAAIDVYSAEGYSLRKQDYLFQAALLREDKRFAPIYPSELALTALDQYWDGGTEAALRSKANSVDGNDSDVAARWSDLRRARQRRAYTALVDNPDARRSLRLPAYHPQCYFDMRKALDASLISLEPADQACLREGARWAAALRAQEMCDAADPLVAKPDGLQCPGGRLAPDPARAAILPPLPEPSACAARMPAYIDPATTDREGHARCRKL